MPDPGPYHDLRPEGDGGAFSIPLRKWRELLFIGALREAADGLFERDPARPLPPMQTPERFAAGNRFRVERIPDPRTGRTDPLNPRIRDRSRILLTPV